MRLTLRTLLAYLDDTLDPTQAKIIGQKVAESDQARELMEHIKQVTRRRRITTPQTNGPNGKIDPNTIAEYLDSTVSAEQANEVEQVCLASDAHLAEVAACHQILALILGEPALVPPMAKTRMYGLVKGPESIPFRKPTSPAPFEPELAPDGDDLDETLRMGLPPLGGDDQNKWLQRALLVGSGFGAAVLLGLAIWHILDLPGGTDDANKDKDTPPIVVAQNDGDKKTPPAKPPEVKVVEPKTNDHKTTEPKTGGKDDPKTKTPPAKKEESGDLPPPFAPDEDPKTKKKETTPVKPDSSDLPPFRKSAPDDRPVRIGKYVMPVATEPSVLVTSQIGKSDWTRLWGTKVEVQSGRIVVALPGCRGDLQLDRGVTLTLWGSLPEILPAPLLFESVVELHNSDEYDLDMTLMRGRVIMESRVEKPTAVRVRFENPAQANDVAIADILLKGMGTKVIIDRGGGFVESPPFFKDPKNPERVAPSAFQGFAVLHGSIDFRFGNDSYGMTAAPGRAMIIWNSVDGMKPPQMVDKLPDAFSLNTTPPTLPKEIDKKIRDEILKARNEVLKAREDLSALMVGKAVDVALAELLKSMDTGRRIMAIRSYAAISNLADLVDALTDERNGDVRQTAIRSLQNWIAVGRDNEYRLYDQLKTRFSAGESEKIMELLHGFPPPDILIDNLNNSCLAIREMSYLNLVSAVPPGQPLPPYSPTMPADQRMAAQMAWREVLRRASAPPPMPPQKK